MTNAADNFPEPGAMPEPIPAVPFQPLPWSDLAQQAFVHALQNGPYGNLKTLVAQGADPHYADADSGNTAAHVVATYDAVEALLILRDLGVDPASRNHMGATPLHIAAWYDSPGVARALAEWEVPHVQDGSGETPLHWAAFRGHESVARVLMSHGVDAQAGNAAGQTALHHAARSGSIPVALALLDRSYARPADVNARDVYESTALHYAASYGNLELCGVLLSAGADRGVVNVEGDTAEHLSWKHHGRALGRAAPDAARTPLAPRPMPRSHSVPVWPTAEPGLPDPGDRAASLRL